MCNECNDSNQQRVHAVPIRREALIAGAAIANAIYDATGGVRVRDYPITLDKLLGQLPEEG